MPQITPAMFWKVIEKAEPRLKAAYVTMAILGAGPAEYISLEREHLRPKDHLVWIPGTKTRVRKGWVAVDERLWHWIEQGVPSPLRYRWLWRWWNRACEAAKVKDFRMYDLRHLSAQYAGDMGATDRDLATHMRHADPKMTHRYSRTATARKVAVKFADKLLEGAA